MKSEGHLCEKCALLGRCSVAKHRKIPIQECEQYQFDLKVRLGQTLQTAQLADELNHEKLDANKQTPYTMRNEGLCATCIAREQCERRHVEGGVWRCADYR